MPAPTKIKSAMDAAREVGEEDGGVDLLPDHVGGVPVDAEALPVADGVQGGPGGPVVVGDFGGVDLQGELDADLVEDVDDGVEAAGEVLVPVGDNLGAHGRILDLYKMLGGK